MEKYFVLYSRIHAATVSVQFSPSFIKFQCKTPWRWCKWCRNMWEQYNIFLSSILSLVLWLNDLFKIHGINSFKTAYRPLWMLCHFYSILLNILSFIIFHYPQHKNPAAFDKLQASGFTALMYKIYNII